MIREKGQLLNSNKTYKAVERRYFMVKIASIASGSNGNCYYFSNDTDRVLIDAGISCKQIIMRMENLGLDPARLSGLFVSHEHSDHVRGIEIFTKRYEIPVYITQGTFDACRFKVNDRLVNFIKPGEKICFGGIKVNPFSKSHDAADPCSFMLNSDKKNVAVMTDIGKTCKNVIGNIKKADAAFLETNYDEDMLKNGMYPHFLKQRILADTGHMSNFSAGLLALEHASSKLKHVVLSHLSGNNNVPELALKTFKGFVRERKDLDINVDVASRDKESSLIDIT